MRVGELGWVKWNGQDFIIRVHELGPDRDMASCMMSTVIDTLGFYCESDSSAEKVGRMAMESEGEEIPFGRAGYLFDVEAISAEIRAKCEEHGIKLFWIQSEEDFVEAHIGPWKIWLDTDTFPSYLVASPLPHKSRDDRSLEGTLDECVEFIVEDIKTLAPGLIR